MKPLGLTATFAALMVGAVIAQAALTQSGEQPQTKASHSKPFRIKGQVAGLYPGASKRLMVTVRNQTNRAVTVRSAKVWVRRATRGCPRSSLSLLGVRPISAPGVRISHRRIPANRKRRYPMRARLLPNAPDGCQGVRVRLGYRAFFVRKR